MYGKIRYDLTKEEIVKRVSYWDLWSYYIPNCELKKRFLSPLRIEKVPSASLFIAYDGTILLKDHALGTFTIWSFLQRKYNLTYQEVLLTINNDFNLGLSSKKFVKPTMNFYGIPQKIKTHKDSPTSKISIKKREWNNYDKDYWNQYCLSLEFITKRNVIPLQNFWVNDILVYWYNPYNPSYCYEFKKDKKRKIYSPYAKNYKFCTNAGNDIWQGEEFLPWIGDILIINKSYKDVLVLESLGYNSVAPQSESHIFDEIKINTYKKRFEKIYLLYDNDETGKKYSKLNCDKHDLIPIFVPIESNCKDISDYIKLKKEKETILLLKNLIK